MPALAVRILPGSALQRIEDEERRALEAYHARKGPYFPTDPTFKLDAPSMRAAGDRIASLLVELATRLATAHVKEYRIAFPLECQTRTLDFGAMYDRILSQLETLWNGYWATVFLEPIARDVWKRDSERDLRRQESEAKEWADTSQFREQINQAFWTSAGGAVTDTVRSVLTADESAAMSDPQHRYHVELSDRIILMIKLEGLVRELSGHEVSRTQLTDYRAGRIAGKIGTDKRLRIESEIVRVAKQYGLV